LLLALADATGGVCGEPKMEAHMRLGLIVSLAVIAVSLSSVPAAAQAQSKNAQAAKTYTPPRTPDGKPDLQGVWNSATLTPFERPKEFAA
jgi:hypothetical protein